MKEFGKNDPEFTAKALGERSEELDAAVIAAKDQAEFAELREFAQALESELKGTATDEGIGEQRMAGIKKSITTGSGRKRVVRFPARMSAIAACFVVGAIGTFVVWMNWDNPFASRDWVEISTAEEPPSQHPAPMDKAPEPSAYASRPEERAFGSGEATRVEIAQLEMLINPGTGSSPTADALNLSLDRAEQGGVDRITREEFMTLQLQGSNDAARPMVANTRRTVANQLEGRSMGYASEAPPPPETNSPFRYGERASMEPANREGYSRIEENGFVSPLDSPLSTFSTDVDTASYANVRRFIENRQLPPADAVRIEELINTFRYGYPQPTGEAPFSVTVDSASAPWSEKNRLVRIGLQGKLVARDQRPAANLVFLVDVSGSMSAANKLPLAQKSLSMLVEQMNADDRIAVVVYAGNSGLALPSTTANNQETIKHAISNLRSGGSTNGGSGINLAYEVAQKHFIAGGINRVILCTDGDFNVGVSDQGALTRLIEEKAKTGVYFSAVGFGQGNYRDDMMESLSNRGNGNYAYVDRESEARKVFVEDMLGTLLTIAKDVKIQVEFNPAKVASYRLIGYENRALAAQDFNDDKKDAGEIGSGHSVTALYEIALAGGEAGERKVDALRYQSSSAPVESAELLTVKLRYKQPDEEESSLIERPFTDEGAGIDGAGDDFRFAASVAGFGMVLRDSEYARGYTMEDVIALAQKSVGNNEGGHKLDFVELARKASEVLRVHRPRSVPEEE